MPIRGCCDNPDCQHCRGSGIIETTPAQEFALQVLCMVSVSDLNADGCRYAIRSLCNLVLGNPPVYPTDSYDAETLCPNCGGNYSACDCDL